jgi:hypothetical protein
MEVGYISKFIFSIRQAQDIQTNINKLSLISGAEEGIPV